MARNKPKNRTKTRKRGRESCSALFLERAAAVVEGDGATILQLLKCRESHQCQAHHHLTACIYQQSHCHVAGS